MDLFAAGLGDQPLRELHAHERGDDQELVHAARGGDRTAFGQLYERYARMVHGVLLAKVPVDAVDDLVHDVFVRVLHRVSTLRNSESFGAWVAAIARNMGNDYHRRSPPEEQFEEDSAEWQQHAPPSAEPESASYVLDAIRSLPDAYREPLILRLVEGMTGPEIAARTGLTHGSVRVNLHRGMELLRARLKPQGPQSVPEKS